ncbi:MAG: phosphate acyltransferase PlsX [Holosporaceae bacterium]|jgi:glycerol-3-phosphate acyltransferase PlsX|nr:phosphate acyltransferase PlsX [Holosporaceae bacterium]
MAISDRKIIAIDGMGGDNAPEAVFKGLSQCCSSNLHFIIFGNENAFGKFKKTLPRSLSYEIRHTDTVVTSDMDVTSSLRSGKNSSMGLAIRAVQSGEAAAVISSGNTGLYMALAKIILKTIEGIDRPAIASILPGKNGRTVCLDLGANSECTVKNLVDFAIVGEALARSVFDKRDVKLALLNIGTEETKGARLVKKTSEILKKLFENYVGFVEGDDFGKGNVDVIVADGFTGNVALKTIEGTAKYIAYELKKSLSASIISKIGALIAMSSLNALKKKFDPRLYNGGILLGLNGIVVKSHGNSDEVGFANSVRFTANILRNNIFDRIREQLEKSKISCASEYCEEK